MKPPLIALMLVAQTAFPQTIPPHEFIDVGTCPGEGCAYGKWQAKKHIRLYAEKATASRLVATLGPGEIVTAVTGDVHTVAGIFILEKPFEHQEGGAHVHKVGERLYVYTYGGEGYYSFWCNGKVGGSISPDDKTKFRIGHWERKPISTWWAKLRRKDGTEGWTPETDSSSFDGTYDGDQGYIK